MEINPDTADLLESLAEWFADRVKEICGKMQRKKRAETGAFLVFKILSKIHKSHTHKSILSF